MIARELRLRSPREFERVRSTGKSWSNRLLVLVVTSNDLGHNRYGFAVGRRVGNAVHRNRAKRLMREAARKLHPQLKQGFDCIWIARNRVSRDTAFDEIWEAASDLVTRAKLVRESEIVSDTTPDQGEGVDDTV